jgi:6,7-dimethyl-8-ribityllumazine synthase
MARTLEGKTNARNFRFTVVVSRFNEVVTKELLEGALNELRRSEVSDSDIQVVWVPGAYEIPVACEAALQNSTPDAVITLGCIIRGQTSHYEHLAQSVSDALQTSALQHQIPVGFGVLTVENMNQALERAGGKVGHKGRDAVRSVIDMVHVLRQLREEKDKESALQDFLQAERSR